MFVRRGVLSLELVAHSTLFAFWRTMHGLCDKFQYPEFLDLWTANGNLGNHNAFFRILYKEGTQGVRKICSTMQPVQKVVVIYQGIDFFLNTHWWGWRLWDLICDVQLVRLSKFMFFFTNRRGDMNEGNCNVILRSWSWRLRWRMWRSACVRMRMQWMCRRMRMTPS